MAGNALEDALFLMDTDFGLKGKVVAGGTAAAALPTEVSLLNGNREGGDPFGGDLGKFGEEALFDDAQLTTNVAGGEPLFGDGDDDDDDDEWAPGAAGINHEDVANAILLQGLYYNKAR